MILLTIAAMVLGLHVSAPTAPAVSSGDEIRTDHMWTCTSKVDLDLVKVTIHKSDRREDAVHLRRGCTGRIGRLEVEQRSGDGVKVAEGVHDLTIGGGSIRCRSKAPRFHQDGIQVMGGSHITFHHLEVSCGRRNARLVNSNLFINQGRNSDEPPRDVVCEDCSFGGWAAHTVSVQRSIDSGVTRSTICIGRFPRLTLSVGDDAVSPELSGNHIRQCEPGQLTVQDVKPTTEFGRRLQLHGLFLAQKGGTKVVAEARPVGAHRFRRVASTVTRPNGRFKLNLHPRIGELVRLRSAAAEPLVLTVHVRPRVVLRLRGGVLVAKVRAARSYARVPAVLQAFRHGRWAAVQHVRLGRGSTLLQPRVHGVRARLAVPPVPGYLAGHSDPVRLP